MDNNGQMSIFNENKECESVDKPVEEYVPYSKYIRSDDKHGLKVKPVVIRVNESMMEGTLIEIPFCTFYKPKAGDPPTAIKYVWTQGGQEQSIDVRGSAIYGLPDEFAFDVLTALFRIYAQDNPNIEFDMENKCWKMNQKINFTFKQLAQEMGYKSFGGNLLERLDGAIQCLNDSTIYFQRSCKAFKDIEMMPSVKNATDEGYIYDEMEETKSIRILKGYRSYKYRKLKENAKRIDYTLIKDRTYVYIDDYFFESLCKSYFKVFDYEQYGLLRMGIAKRMFLLLNKWRNKKRTVFLKWETLYGRIPLTDEKSESYRRRRIRDACEQLVSVDYIESYDSNQSGVKFMFEDGVEDEITQSHEKTIGTSTQNKFENMGLMMSMLENIGFTKDEISYTINTFSLDVVRDALENCFNLSDNPNNIKEKMISEMLKGND